MSKETHYSVKRVLMVPSLCQKSPNNSNNNYINNTNRSRDLILLLLSALFSKELFSKVDPDAHLASRMVPPMEAPHTYTDTAFDTYAHLASRMVPSIEAAHFLESFSRTLTGIVFQKFPLYCLYIVHAIVSCC
jgi:hypothetical protein